MTTAEESLLRDIISAWESLPGSRYYSAYEVGLWLGREMKPAIDKARKHLGLPTEQSQT